MSFYLIDDIFKDKVKAHSVKFGLFIWLGYLWKNDICMQDKLVSRKRECDELQRCLESDRSEFVIISGRCRIGKTYLIDK